MRWKYLLMTSLLAALCFGGTFTCKGEKNSSTVGVPR
jgi:hypothetical protein